MHCVKKLGAPTVFPAPLAIHLAASTSSHRQGADKDLVKSYLCHELSALLPPLSRSTRASFHLLPSTLTPSLRLAAAPRLPLVIRPKFVNRSPAFMMETPAEVLDQPQIERVQLEGLVVMKVIKHCQENFPMTVMGQLLGMDRNETLEITNCYPFMSQPGGAASAGPDGLDLVAFEREQQQYQRDMMWCVREVHIDHQVVGWYQSTGSQMGSFLSSQWIETQFNYQNHLSNIVCLVYDPVRTEEGTLSIHAYRLTKKFMDVMRNNDFTSLGFANEFVTASSIIEEVPITLHNSSLINAALVELDHTDEFSGANDVELTRLSISDKPVLEQSMDFLISDLDVLGREQSKYSYYMRNLVRGQGQLLERMRKRRAENVTRVAKGEEPLPDDEDVRQVLDKEPPRLETKILLKELDSYVESIKSLASEGIVKQYGVSAVQAGEE